MKNVIAATLLTFTASIASADISLLTAESLMHAQATDALSLSLLTPPAATTTLQYTYTADTNDGSFAYQALSGQTYNGMSYSASGSGTVDPSTQALAWTSSGMLGGETWSQTGSGLWVGDPTLDVTIEVRRNGMLVATITGTVEVAANGSSMGTGTFTPVVGVPRPVTITDQFTPAGPWKQNIAGTDFGPIDGTWTVASNANGVFAGNADVIVAVPEPSTWMMLALGAIVLLGRQVRSGNAVIG